MKFLKRNDYINFIMVVLCGSLEELFIIWQMYVISVIANKVFVENIVVSALYGQLIKLAIVMLLANIWAKLSSFFANKLGFNVKENIANLILHKLDRMGGVYGSGVDSAKCFNLLTITDSIDVFFAAFLPQILKCALVVILFLVIILPKDLISGLILLITMPIVIIFMMLIGRFAKEASEKQWRVLYMISGYLHDAMLNLAWIKMWGKTKESVVKVEKMANDFSKSTFKVMKIAFLSSFVLELFTMISIALVAVILGVRLVNGMIDFKVALFIILLAPEFYKPLRNLGSKYHDSIRAISGFKDVLGFLNLPENVRGNKTLNLTFAPKICLEKVSYTYASSNDGVKDINLTLMPNTTTLIMGESGSGKSTLINLVSGILLANSGDVLYDDVKLNEVCLQDVRNNVGFLGQDVYIFAKSVYENIALDDKLITKEIVKDACIKLNFDKVINNFSDGYDTLLGEDGRGLSGGQRKMIGILRIFVRKRLVVFCDEPVANLDYESEQMVYKALKELFKDRTVLVVSHRKESLALADSCFEMNKLGLVKR